MKKLGYATALLILSGPLIGCMGPVSVPPEKLEYVGEWRNKNTELIITGDGRIIYRRSSGSSSSIYRGPLKHFAGDSFETGVWFITKTFVVTKPPQRINARWTMTVNGEELTKQ